mmetsp:Transcript_8264/g.17743  ORF Transcript_8264/g.17743 Transcript_8264/m.17743 type:complete len:85 (+) Transcript_8264:99-353(+)
MFFLWAVAATTKTKVNRFSIIPLVFCQLSERGRHRAAESLTGPGGRLSQAYFDSKAVSQVLIHKPSVLHRNRSSVATETLLKPR